ncbi:MAG: ketose-bisphosphate aldolase [Planctomycetes bacterium RBG_16_64_12]|nr:MAG: ketose-bisphosphate aldolase [Planctomycetes bacterium RBG_16_64_12]
MLATAKEVLADARTNRYAVPAFDCVEDVMVRAVLETAEAHRAPVFIMGLEPDMEGGGWRYLSGLVKVVADYHKVPVVLHLDHADRLDWIQNAVDLGFTSVMIDGSKLPFEENVRLTRAAVDIAHPRGVSVEGELGHVGGMDLDATQCAENVLTEPDEVARFVEETGVDALAVSIGTSHGVYRSLPTLNIDRLKELHEASPVPLVMHGGSGTPPEQIQDAVRHGISKLNIYADCRLALARGLEKAHQALKRPDPLPREVFGPIYNEIAGVVKEKIALLFADNRV